MEEELKQRLSSKDIWVRALYMILFAIAYSIAEFVIIFLVIFQFLAILFTRHANEPLLKLGKSLSTYVLQLLRFQTFNTETRPFPFSDWPVEEMGDNRWLEDYSSEDDEPNDITEREVATDDEPVDASDDASDEESDDETKH
ncbi:MAG: DUF4389 domain-containing protein [Gammaproteobacteria bacterium]|nr:DUF4389 domain-containing protein [Gammaproteobacteria bacterium]MCZ6852582.1 DUF4389 domain-containing protein [Gammaproteobacteria bacterium]